MINMNKLILLALTALMMVGCDQISITEHTIEEDFTTIECDSCEYLFRTGLSGTSYLAHKGNCKFCKERKQKELEELVTKLKEK